MGKGRNKVKNVTQIEREEIKEPTGQGVGRGINVPNKIIMNYDGAVLRIWE